VPNSRPKARVLVLAREAVIAALVGMLLELEEFEPVFPAPDERPEDAIRRLRPPLIVVLDGELPEARSDLFFARCAQSGARVCLFSEPVAADDVRAVARERRAAFFAMPVERRELGAVLERVLADAG
jgi:DNA-binding NtrC family response regulator